MRAAKIPQHLELEDVVAWGLGAADLLCLGCGVAAAWWIASSLDGTLALRAVAAALALALGAALGLVRPADRSLRSWAAVAFAFVTRRRVLLTEARGCR